MQDTIGIDISRNALDVHRLPGGAAARFENTKAGIDDLIRWLGCGVGRVVYEPTGRYHRALERRLSAAGYPLARINPLHARRFAQALGRRARTDRIDAEVLARMGVALRPETRPARSEISHDLNELIIARRALVKDRIATKNRAGGLSLAILCRQNRARLKRIEADLKAIDAAIQALIRADSTLSARLCILLSIPGLAEVTAAALLALMPELGVLNSRTAASLAGLAPVTRQSGQWQGRAFIQGGRALLREALYMPALSAARFNPDLKQLHDRLVAAGKPPKVAITAVMRKLIILANALIRDHRMWTPNLA